MSIYNRSLKLNYNLAPTLPVDKRKRSAGGYVVPPVTKTPPPVNQTVVNVYDNKLNWMGWMPLAVKPEIPWWYSINYKTGGMYETKAERYGLPSGFQSGYRIVDKVSGKVALWFGIRSWSEVELMDENDNEKKITHTLEGIKKWGAPIDSSSLSYSSVPDPFKLIPTNKLQETQEAHRKRLAELEKQFRQMRGDAATAYKQELVDILQDQLNAHGVLKKGEEETGFDLGS
jgi:hypothetical protein